MTNRPSELSTILCRSQAPMDAAVAAARAGRWGRLLAATVITLAGFGARFARRRAKAFRSSSQPPWSAPSPFSLSAAPSGRFGGRPTDRQIARFIEERGPDLDDVVVTAVDAGRVRIFATHAGAAGRRAAAALARAGPRPRHPARFNPAGRALRPRRRLRCSALPSRCSLPRFRARPTSAPRICFRPR